MFRSLVETFSSSLSFRGSLAARNLGFLLAACLLTAQLVVAQTAASTDPFTALHANLLTAADKTLADALADRPWMRPAPTDKDQPSAAVRIQRVTAAVQRVEQLRPVIEPILRAEGVPPDVIAVALVESGGQAAALSPKGARGVWQFMPQTARRYGLVVSEQRDERTEIVKSTRAAARYLRDLHQQFGDWQLAFAAYNAGEQTIQRALARVGQRDFLALQHALPNETRNYVPAVLQAISVFGGNPSRFAVVRPYARTGGRVLYASADEDSK